MERIEYIRGLKCNCGEKLLKVYIRGKGKFKSLENWFYCESCSKMFMAGVDYAK